MEISQFDAKLEVYWCVLTDNFTSLPFDFQIDNFNPEIYSPSHNVSGTKKEKEEGEIEEEESVFLKLSHL